MQVTGYLIEKNGTISEIMIQVGPAVSLFPEVQPSAWSGKIEKRQVAVWETACGRNIAFAKGLEETMLTQLAKKKKFSWTPIEGPRPQCKMNQIRVRHETANRWVLILIDQGYKAHYKGSGTAKTELHNGCADPDCCIQHECADNPGDWGTVVTNATGNEAREAWDYHFFLKSIEDPDVPCGPFRLMGPNF